jgi:hypothetical protein
VLSDLDQWTLFRQLEINFIPARRSEVIEVSALSPESQEDQVF